MDCVSIPFIGSNLFKLAKKGLRAQGKSVEFQSPLSGQICLNAYVQAQNLIAEGYVSIPFIGSNLFKCLKR